jgi:hypothetical protein
LKDKKGLGVTGTNFEPLGPQLAQRAAELNAESSGNDKQPTDSEGDSEMSDSSSSFSDDEDITAGDFMPLNLSAYIARGEDKSQIPAMEPNPYFVIDTNPTPVVVNGIGSTLKKTKKRANDEDDKPTPKKSKKVKKEAAVVPEAKPESEEEEKEKVNFEAVEAQLQAEVEAGLKAKAAEAEKAEETKAKKEKKKRRRSEVSEDSERVAEKKVKKEKSEKKEKKEKKRKVEDGADAKAVADDGGIKKKRKHKVDADA